MLDEMVVYTSWDLFSRSDRLIRSIMIVGFQAEDISFTEALDEIIKTLLSGMVAKFNQ